MRIAAVADLHIGSGPDLHPDRLGHQATMWEAMCRQMEREADMLVIAGDVFHRRKPTPAEYLAFEAGFSEFHGPKVMIAGNHDVAAMDEPTALDVFGDRFDSVVRQPGVVWLDPEVAALPWTSAAHFRAQHGQDPALADRPVVALLMEAARGLRAECQTMNPILLTHWSLTGARTPSGQSVDEFREPVLPVGELADMGWGAVVAGHIHVPDVLAEPSIFYCGSPWLIDYGEADVRHGWWLLAGDHLAGWTRRFVENPLEHRFVTADVDASDVSWIPHWPRLRDAVVRVRVRCTDVEAVELDVAAMRRSLVETHGALHVYQVQVNVERAERRRATVDVEALAPDDALELWLGQENERAPLEVDVWPAHNRYMEEVSQ